MSQRTCISTRNKDENNFDFCAKLHYTICARQASRGSESALAVNVQPLQSPPAVKVWWVFCLRRKKEVHDA